MVMLPDRKVTRLRSWNYAASGFYYLTICTHNRSLLFGEVLRGQMELADWGKIADEEIQRSVQLRPEFSVDSHIVMPDHVHMVLVRSSTEAANIALGYQRRQREARSVSTFVAGYKAAVTTAINTARNSPGQPVWQRGF